MEHFESEIDMGPVMLPVRSTYIRTNNGGLLFSPIKMSADQIQKIKKLGGVDYIIAPTLLHHLYVRKAQQAFPNAKLLGVPGFDKKRPDLNWNGFIDEKNWPFKNEIEFVTLEGSPKTNETVFFHKNSKTLLVWDLCFNLKNCKGPMAPIMFRLFGTYNRFATSRLFKLFIKDKLKFKNSVTRVLDFDFEKVVVAHGDIVDKNGKNLIKEALRERKLID